MFDYVENDYVESDYVEGSVDESSSFSCDLSSVLNEVNLLKIELSSLKSMLGNLILNSQNFATKDDLDSVGVNFDFSTLATKDYIDFSMPFVDDMTLKAYKKGDVLSIAGTSEPCIVMSSKFLPHDEYTFIIVYTVGYEKNGVSYVSDFPAHHVLSKFTEVL